MVTVLRGILGVIVLFGGIGFIVALVALAKSR
jgi:hypothetical protein